MVFPNLKPWFCVALWNEGIWEKPNCDKNFKESESIVKEKI